jgi:hypothetical protein
MLVRLGDPRAVPCFHCPFLLGMPSSTATGSPSAALTQSFTDDMGLRLEPNGSVLPRLPIIRFRRAEGFRGFTGSLSLRPVELHVSLADLTRVPPSQRRLLLPSFPTGQSPFPRSDITTVATEQTPPMGLSPIGTSASIAAQAPSLHPSYPASSVLRASPLSQSARPFSRELPVDPHGDHRWDFPCCVVSPWPACRRQYPGRSDRTWLALTIPSASAFPEIGAGRLLHKSFRGLLSVHSRYGLHARQAAWRLSTPEASAVSLPPLLL